MALSSIIKLALPFVQHEVAKRINVVGNKADIVFTRLDNDLYSVKTLTQPVTGGKLSSINNTVPAHVVLPVVPSELPTLNVTFNHETFNTLQGDISVMGNQGLTTLTLEDYLLPSGYNKYPFVRPYGSSAKNVLDFLVRAQQDFVPLRIIIVYHDGRIYLNMPCLVESISHYKDAVDDMHITVNLIEYVEMSTGSFEYKGVRLRGR